MTADFEMGKAVPPDAETLTIRRACCPQNHTHIGNGIVEHGHAQRYTGCWPLAVRVGVG
eukprot:CAMPEP_0179278486 /NCGR_PEP_ID=MMETSP0797-20121207/35631_1 /TAXON_ID=47934 /ORGANISM="Dinophysis acuminata, Strain DAEP01" /LENGTH=58 /DNA_ID=CAMNT_0020987101 /DNA_START=155 /DNA_END=328 /DNA_ORIENTATION=+